MANFIRIFFFAIAFALLAMLYVAQGNDTLENYKKYKIFAVANELVMTAEEGKYDEYLGIVHMEQFQDLDNQKWEYMYSREASVFSSQQNHYNNVTTYHEKGSFMVFKDFTVSANNDNVYTIKEKSSNKVKNPKCLQNTGKGKAVQLLPCKRNFKNQQWRFEILPDSNE